MTPTQDEAAVRLARRSYPLFAKTVVEKLPDQIKGAFGNLVKEEIKVICSDHPKSIVQSDDVTAFSWSSVWSEFQTYMPNLTSVDSQVVRWQWQAYHGCLNHPKIQQSKDVPCTKGVSNIFGWKFCPQKGKPSTMILSLLRCLQPLMVTLSYSTTLDVVDRISAGHDSLPIGWKESLLHSLPVIKTAHY